MRGGQPVAVRLNGIDTPEEGQRFGLQAKQFVSMLALGKTVRVQIRFSDAKGRIFGEVVLPDGRSLNHEVVRAGYAWHFTRYSNSVELVALEEEAREARRGLWIDAQPQPPWEFQQAAQADAPKPSAPAARVAPEGEAKPPFVGNKRSKIFHWPDCPGYGAVKAKNRVPFSSREEAEAKGYRAARNCP